MGPLYDFYYGWWHGQEWTLLRDYTDKAVLPKPHQFVRRIHKPTIGAIHKP